MREVRPRRRRCSADGANASAGMSSSSVSAIARDGKPRRISRAYAVLTCGNDLLVADNPELWENRGLNEVVPVSNALLIRARHLIVRGERLAPMTLSSMRELLLDERHAPQPERIERSRMWLKMLIYERAHDKLDARVAGGVAIGLHGGLQPVVRREALVDAGGDGASRPRSARDHVRFS